MADVFKLDGQYKSSSEIPTITIGGKEVSRADFWKQQIDAKVAELPATPEGTQATYIATGGGYGSNQALVDYERSQGKIGTDVVSMKGDLFRNLQVFDAEKEKVRDQIRQHLGAEALEKNPNAVEQTLSAFYSDEVNTKIAKEVVKAAFPANKSVIYESASLYPDTVERAVAAGMGGLKTVLVAGDKDLDTAIEGLKAKIEPANTATSYKKFSARFEGELVPLFDEVRLYNADGETPVLIAEKKGKGQKLEILDQGLYDKFLAKKDIDPEQYKSPTADSNVINEDHKKREGEKSGGKAFDPSDMLPSPQTPWSGQGRSNSR